MSSQDMPDGFPIPPNDREQESLIRPSKELVERYEKHVQAAGFLRLGAENKRLLAQFADWLSSETNEHPALKAGDELAHQSVYSPFHERWWQARGGHDKCTVCVPGNPHTAEWFCLCGEPLPDPRADCPKCTPLKASTETLLQQPVAWRCKNGFGDWRYTSVSPVSSPYSPAYEPLYVRAESKASEQAGHHCGMLKAECKDEFCPTHGQDIR